jgi:hypothetical protein
MTALLERLDFKGQQVLGLLDQLDSQVQLDQLVCKGHRDYQVYKDLKDLMAVQELQEKPDFKE